jgi:hypothetical protein
VAKVDDLNLFLLQMFLYQILSPVAASSAPIATFNIFFTSWITVVASNLCSLAAHVMVSGWDSWLLN